NFKLFLLVSLKAIREVAVPILLLTLLFSFFLIIDIGLLYGVVSYYELISVISIIFFALFLRPSIQRKTWDYVASYWKHLLYLIIFYIIYLIVNKLTYVLFILGGVGFPGVPTIISFLVLGLLFIPLLALQFGMGIGAYFLIFFFF